MSAAPAKTPLQQIGDFLGGVAEGVMVWRDAEHKRDIEKMTARDRHPPTTMSPAAADGNAGLLDAISETQKLIGMSVLGFIAVVGLFLVFRK